MLKSNPKKIINFLLLSQTLRRVYLITIDALIIPISIFYSLEANSDLKYFHTLNFWLIATSIFIGLSIYLFTGQYKGLSSYVNSRSFYRIALRNLVFIAILIFLGSLLKLELPSFNRLILLFFLLTAFGSAIRVLLRDLLINFRGFNDSKRIKVAIYGAGEAGAQLAASLRSDKRHTIITFIDDNKLLWGRELMGILISSPSELDKLKKNIDQVLLAIPSLNRNRRIEIIDQLQNNGLSILQIPTLDDLYSGKARIDSLRPIDIEDLLGRDQVPPFKELLGPGIKNANICITGGGGSIGSELCRQILRLSPKKLIILEKSEHSLYLINQELKEKSDKKIIIKPTLGDASDFNFLNKLFADESVQIVFHAAAYKHVPLVEDNPISGISNNVLSTSAICKASRINNLKKVILISTDKAVRPANIMGASKRLAEIIVQAHASEVKKELNFAQNEKTIFAMVRFGNVLDSSGSVIPLFKKQIKKGGPLTITHPEVIRYFMTINESVQLVIQASVFAIGGEVFLLDMGQPVKIIDLAKKMIKLSGLNLKDSNNINGDIELVYTGLRPGEKLYEELLIDKEAKVTKHPLIYCANESFIDPKDLWPKLNKLETALTNHNQFEVLKCLKEIIPEWNNKR
ncbi:polysaccharide biosynthesis protein [Prochlorococcus sp. AH-716-B04]|nr:polysaccharide biosynthesis protein [Prochlorococcus sp. AH-716-B04]